MVWIAPARGAEPTDQTIHTLRVAADTHTPQSTALRDQRWDSKTVARLGQWATGKPDVATKADLELLRAELGRPISISVTGAVSLGSYQGGFLYYYVRALTEARKLAADAPGLLATTHVKLDAGDDLARPWGPPGQGSPVSLVTGASSGSINALIAAIASCQKPVVAPRESLFWTTWLPVNADALSGSGERYSDGLLSEAPISDAINRLTQNWDGHTWSDDPLCAVDVGLSATRIRARSVTPLDGVDLSLPVQTEKLMFSMRGDARTPSAAPDLSPFAPPDSDALSKLFKQRLRQLGDQDKPTFKDVTDLLRASSSFSFAFPPNPINLTSRDGKRTVEDGVPFTDGGVFDDRPVGLAVQMQRWRYEIAKGDETTSHTRYIIQDPDATEWPDVGATKAPPPSETKPAKAKLSTKPAVGAKATPSGPEHGPFLDTWLPFVEDFVGTAFEIELMDTLEREPSLYAGIEVPPRREPVAGAYLLEFMAFAESDFRVFDFFTGMVDAWQQLAQSSLAFQVLEAAGKGPVLEHAPEFDCLLAWRTHRLMNAGAPPRSACAGVGNDPTNLDPLLRPNLEALLHASAVTRVWAGSPHPAAPGEQQVFLNALGGAPTPYVYRQLKYHGRAADAGTVDLAFREDLQGIIETTTRKQPISDVGWPSVSRVVVGTGAKAAANFYVYRPPTVFFGVGLVSDRGGELVAAHTLGCDCIPSLRIDGALRFIGMHVGQNQTESVGNETLVWSPMLAAHITSEIPWRWQSVVEPHVGVGWAAKAELDGSHPVLWRNGPEVVFGGAGFQRLYLDFVVDYFLDDCAGNNRCANVSSKVIAGAAPITDSAFGFRFDLGLRLFLD
jgi:hypothetical protein